MEIQTTIVEVTKQFACEQNSRRKMHGHAVNKLKIRQECILKSHENASPSDRVKLKQQL